jgi:hypothetical protein
MSAIDLNRMSGSSFEGMKPRRLQNAAVCLSELRNRGRRADASDCGESFLADEGLVVD